MKYKRHSEILKIIRNKQIKTHEQLINELAEAGFKVTQATVSRDIKELGLVKAPMPGSSGSVYVLPGESASADSDKHLSLFSDAVLSVEHALHTIVIKTFPGMAPAIAASLDSMVKKNILGSIAGDDTILIITPGEAEAAAMAQTLSKMFKSGAGA